MLSTFHDIDLFLLV